MLILHLALTTTICVAVSVHQWDRELSEGSRPLKVDFVIYLMLLQYIMNSLS